MFSSKPTAFPLLLILTTMLSFPAAAQEKGEIQQVVPLDDLSAFHSKGANWQIVGQVTCDRTRRHHISPSPGTGILANLPNGQGAADLFSAWEHGDIRLAMEVMVPRGSNSGIYLQGRYEVQILDSWDVNRPTYGDMGGIYQRWDPTRPEGQKGYQGKSPRANAARAPGLWQRLTIDFQAPRFNEDGEKTRNAVFKKVTLNGITVHEDVSLTGPTRGPSFDGEVPRAPLVIQGDHGPVAFRNLSYEHYAAEVTAFPDSLSEVPAPDPIFLEPNARPRVVRSYIRHNGQKRTHVVSVGDPSGVHYTYDLSRGSLLKVWKGRFAETTKMWHGRGIEQELEPGGSVIARSGASDIGFLPDQQSAWPDSLRSDTNFQYHGYDRNDAGYPTFSYQRNETRIHDSIEPLDHGLKRTLSFEGDTAALWIRLAADEEIRVQSDGSYRVDGASYYLRLDQTSGAEPLLRTTADGEELLLRVPAVDARISYSMIW